MDEKTRLIQSDFDRLAAFEGDGWTHNRHYSDYLLKQLPTHCHAACEIGCGAGEMARSLAARCDSVLALDLSPEMIRLAEERSAGFPNIRYVVADVMTYDLPMASFDAIVSVATLHHMDAESVFNRLKNALAPGGVLAVLDLYQFETPADFLMHIAAVPVDMFMKMKHRGYLRDAPDVRAVWEEHGKHDSYLTLAQVRDLSRKFLPGAVVRRHLLWRYSLIWKKPG